MLSENPFAILERRLNYQEELLNDIKSLLKPEGATKDKEKYLTFSETCEAFDCSSVTLHKWKREGKIKFYRMGGKIYFKRSEVYGLQAAKIAK